MSIERARRLVALTLAAALVAGGVSLLAQRGRGQGRGGGGQVELPPITVNFRALSSDGTPVGDLTAGDLTLKVDGRDRTLDALRLVEFEAGAAPSGEGGLIAPPPPFGSNLVAADARNIMILFNDTSILAGQESGVKSALSEFVGRLGAETRIAFMTTPYGATNINFTTDRMAIQTGLSQVAGKALPNDTQLDFECTTGQVLSELNGIFTGMSADARAPTTIIFVSAGMAASTTAAARMASGTAGRAGGEGGPPSDRGTECEIRPDTFSELETRAATAQVQMYVLQPEGASSPLRGEEGLENLAGVTDGDKYLIGSSGSSILDRVALETSAYYSATFQVEMDERNNEAHRLEVDVARAGVTVRAPNSVFLGRSMGGGGGRGGESMSAVDMLRSPDGFPDLQLKTVGVSSRIASGSEKLKVILMAEPVDRTVELVSAAAALITTDGRLVSQWTAQPEELAAYPFITALTADPGEYRLRVAATDVDGRGGAVDYPMTVELHEADTIRISDLALMVGTDAGPRPILEVRDEPEVMVYFELYGQPPPDLLAIIDLAQHVDGDELMGVQLNAAPSAEPDKFLINAILPMEQLPAGDYVVRLTFGRNPETKLYQTIRKLESGG